MTIRQGGGYTICITKAAVLSTAELQLHVRDFAQRPEGISVRSAAESSAARKGKIAPCFRGASALPFRLPQNPVSVLRVAFPARFQPKGFERAARGRE